MPCCMVIRENNAERREWPLLFSRDRSGKTCYVRRLLSREWKRRCSAPSSDAGHSLLRRDSSCLVQSSHREETSVATVEPGWAGAAGTGLRVKRGEVRSCR